MKFSVNRISFLVVLATLVALPMLQGCKTAQKQDGTAGSDGVGAVDENALGDSDSGRAMGLQTVNFPYDSHTLTSEARTTLKNNAEVMKKNSGLKVQIEGHCDQRGGIQYNIALGEKRAAAVKSYLVSQGVAGNRVSTISYGKERPLSTADTEAAHAQNRRANFVITSR